MNHIFYALPIVSIRSSLLQETVRRLQNCSLDLDVREKQKILSRFACKLVNSGHSTKSARIIIIQGITKFLYKVELSNLDPSDSQYKPLYLDKYHMEDERHVSKYMAKMTWFKQREGGVKEADEDGIKGWRNRLEGTWRGENVVQRKVRHMQFSTLLQVPNTRGGILARNLIKAESELAKMTGYNVKIVEKAGIQSCRLFQRVFTPAKCH